MAALLIPYWFYAGITHSLPWTWWLSVLALVYLIVFFLVFRSRHPNPTKSPPRTEGHNGKLLGHWLSEQGEEKKLVGLSTIIMIDGQVGTKTSRNVAVVTRRLSQAAAARAMCRSPHWPKISASTGIFNAKRAGHAGRLHGPKTKNKV